jgi:hypothetical protein
VVVDFADEQNEAVAVVPDSAITAKTIITVVHDDEDLGIQGVTFGVSKIIGVSYAVTAYAPHGASGQYNVTAILQEGA